MTFIEASSYLSLGIIFISMILIFIRLIKGPSLSDRIVALDLLTVLIIGVAGCYAIITNTTTVLDIGIIIGLIGFLGICAFAYYIQKRAKL